MENLILLKHCGASISPLSGSSWISVVPSLLESFWEMARALVFERAGSKPYAYRSEVGIQAHKAQTWLAILEQSPRVGIHLVVEYEVGSSACNAEQATPFNSN